jgi:peptidoglycan hydrolase-like protein with peptidoglycan-binding domain
VRGVLVVAGVAAVAAGAFAVAVFRYSGASLEPDPSALARVQLETFAGSVASVRSSVPLAVHDGRLTPLARVRPGQAVSITVVVRRPGWSAWALGRERREQLTVTAPVARVVDRWPAGEQPRVRFDTAVARVTVDGRAAAAQGRTVALSAKAPAGTALVAAAARPWEELGAPVRVTWFPRSERTVVLAEPKPGTELSPLDPLRLTFSRPVGHERPRLSPTVPGTWHVQDSHTLVFHPSGFGMPFDSHEKLLFEQPVQVVGGGAWHVAGASFLRLQQLLAEQGYLPLSWSSHEAEVPRTFAGELRAATEPPAGKFRWRYPATPHELVSLWQTGKPNEIVRGAVMMFQHDHGLAVDAIAGPQVWHALIADAVHGKRKDDGYSYVYVHRNVPQLLTLWHNGRVVLTSPGNTGVPAAPTQLGTWPVFEHIPVGRMSGTNPDGSHYDDPGIRWISYFHGGEALHAFPRATFGTPQSLGCVELPLDAAEKVWPYTPIGTLVTIEN